ncbi:alpha-N-acetylgalactosamine-specific lectin-like [Nerophis ophidion]|uniref:alpha-N-acetylgalactosamine-specific lectin-like n=1 Tax=Nerophis ophidion TaxID=159077 RepID=UPI002AE04328|nr:alpha-N-acetylgalactosamine-specific lectin-like [Nerophis ophidion]
MFVSHCSDGIFSWRLPPLCDLWGVDSTGQYIYQKGPKTFAEAEDICITKFGANLVSFHNVKEYQEVLEVIQANNDGAMVDTWIGLDHTIQKGTFFWTAGQVYAPTDIVVFPVKSTLVLPKLCVH